ncbi:MAG: hypothetical protein AB7V32_07125, partial [Candidatus Berkiella sp.]
LVEHPHIDEKQTCVVNLTAFGPSALEILIYCFTDTKTWASYLAIRQNVLLKIAAIVDAHDAKLAFPTQTLEIQNPMGFDQTRASQQPQRSKYS